MNAYLAWSASPHNHRRDKWRAGIRTLSIPGRRAGELADAPGGRRVEVERGRCWVDVPMRAEFVGEETRRRQPGRG